jgi:hypothetical protein
MPRYPLLLLLALAGAVPLLTGMVNRQAPSPPPPPPSAGGAEIAEPARFLDRAIEAYAPERITWAELRLWQRIVDDGAAYEVQGRYLAAPGHRLRLELETRVGRTRAAMKWVSDGRVLWQWQRVGTQAPTLLGTELPHAQTGLSTADQVAWAVGETLRTKAFGGVSPLLKMVRERLGNLRGKAIRWRGFEIIQVTGAWPEDPGQLADMPDYLRPRHVPRLCSIYLDAKTLWPHRVEWWGSEQPDDQPVLLLQTEFREPVLNRPLPPDRCAQEFSVPG